MWRQVEGYPKYEVSDAGEVRNKKSGRIVKQSLNRYGYKCVMLYTDNKQSYRTVHRLVAGAFLPNPNNFPQVNHIDEDKTNNDVSNLEWCTAEYNSNYGTRNERESATKGRPCMSIDEQGNVTVYRSARYAAKCLGLRKGNHILWALNGKRKHAYGKVWVWMTEK